MNEDTIMICTQCGEFDIGSDKSICQFCGGTLASTNITTAETQNLSTDEFMKWRSDMQKRYSPGYETFSKEKTSKKPEEELGMGSYVPKCPTCGCPNIRRLKPHENAFHLAQTAGRANWACKTFLCLNCGYAW